MGANNNGGGRIDARSWDGLACLLLHHDDDSFYSSFTLHPLPRWRKRPPHCDKQKYMYMAVADVHVTCDSRHAIPADNQFSTNVREHKP